MEEEDIDATDCYCDICEEDGNPMSAKTKEQQEGLCWDCVKFDENKKQEKKKAFKEVIPILTTASPSVFMTRNTNGPTGKIRNHLFPRTVY